MYQENKPPANIGNYEIISPIARGLVSEVFLARLGSIFYAVKVLYSRYVNLLESAAKFVEEITHENILRYVAIESDSRYQYYLVLDNLEVSAVSWQGLKGEGRGKILDVFIQVVNGLALAHSKGVTHGNLNPSNILIRRKEDGSPLPIVSDFGLSYVYEKNYFSGKNFRKVFPYMSPDSIAYFTSCGAKGGFPKSVTSASDVYSLAAVLVETLTGQSLYD